MNKNPLSQQLRTIADVLESGDPAPAALSQLADLVHRANQDESRDSVAAKDDLDEVISAALESDEALGRAKALISWMLDRLDHDGRFVMKRVTSKEYGERLFQDLAEWVDCGGDVAKAMEAVDNASKAFAKVRSELAETDFTDESEESDQ